MDEGAQSREPEAVAPLTFASRDTKIIIAGDHKQVDNFSNCLATSTVCTFRSQVANELHSLVCVDLKFVAK